MLFGSTTLLTPSATTYARLLPIRPKTATFTQLFNVWKHASIEWLAFSALLLKRHLRKAPQLARMQLAWAFGAQQINGPHADAQVLVYPFAVKVLGHAGPLVGRAPSRGR